MSAQKGQTKEHQLLHKYISNICFYYCPNISNISFYKLSKNLKKSSVNQILSQILDVNIAKIGQLFDFTMAK